MRYIIILEISTCDTLKIIMDNPILIVLIGKFHHNTKGYGCFQSEPYISDSDSLAYVKLKIYLVIKMLALKERPLVQSSPKPLNTLFYFQYIRAHIPFTFWHSFNVFSILPAAFGIECQP